MPEPALPLGPTSTDGPQIRWIPPRPLEALHHKGDEPRWAPCPSGLPSIACIASNLRIHRVQDVIMYACTHVPGAECRGRITAEYGSHGIVLRGEGHPTRRPTTLPSGYRRRESRCRLHRRCSPTNALMSSRPNTVSRSRRTRMTLCRPRYLLPRRLVGGRDQYGGRRRTLSSGFPSSGRFFRPQNLEGSRHRPCRGGQSRKSTRGGTVKYGWATIWRGSGTPGSFAALDAMDRRRAGLRGGKVIGYRRTATNRFIKRHSITLDQPRRGTTYTKSDENMLGDPPLACCTPGVGSHQSQQLC